MTILDYQKKFDTDMQEMFELIIKYKREMDVSQVQDTFKNGYTINRGLYWQSEEDISVSFHPKFESSFHWIDQKTSLHNHSFFELAYVYKGTYTNYFENEQFTMTEGDILLLNPNVKHNVQTEGQDDCLVNLIIQNSLFEKSMLSLLSGNHLILNFFAKYIYNVGQARDYIYFQNTDDPTISQVMESFVSQYFEKPEFYQNVCQSYLVILLSRLSLAYSKQIGLEPNLHEKDSNIINILGYMNENCSNISLEKVAQQFNYSESHLRRLIKKHTGKTFKEVQQNYKLEKVKRSLHKTDFSIEHIAKLMNYYDVDYMCKKFKNKYGVTPSEHRKQIHENCGEEI